MIPRCHEQELSMNRQVKNGEDSLHLDKDYKNFLSDIKNHLKTAQIRVALAVNSELIRQVFPEMQVRNIKAPIGFSEYA